MTPLIPEKNRNRFEWKRSYVFFSSTKRGLGPEARRLATLFSKSNQNGAPKLTPSPVSNHPKMVKSRVDTVPAFHHSNGVRLQPNGSP